MSEEKEERWPANMRFGMFTKERGTHDYKKDIAEKRVKDGEYEELKNAGGFNGGKPLFRFKPRYTDWRPLDSSEERIREALEDEKSNYEKMLNGEYGANSAAFAEKSGLAGIGERIEKVPDGLLITDMLVDEKWLNRIVPVDSPADGLWEITEDFENEDCDRRVKGDWTKAPIWPKGSRFVISLDKNAYALVVRGIEVAIEALSDEPDDDGKLAEKIKLLQSRLEDENYLRSEAGYTIRKCERGTAKRIPLTQIASYQRLKSMMRTVPILTVEDALDYSGASEVHCKEVMKFMAREKYPAWSVANLLVQAREGRGYFEEMPDEFKEEK